MNQVMRVVTQKSLQKKSQRILCELEFYEYYSNCQYRTKFSAPDSPTGVNVTQVGANSAKISAIPPSNSDFIPVSYYVVTIRCICIMQDLIFYNDLSHLAMQPG